MKSVLTVFWRRQETTNHVPALHHGPGEPVTLTCSNSCSCHDNRWNSPSLDTVRGENSPTVCFHNLTSVCVYLKPQVLLRPRGRRGEARPRDDERGYGFDIVTFSIASSRLSLNTEATLAWGAGMPPPLASLHPVKSLTSNAGGVGGETWPGWKAFFCFFVLPQGTKVDMVSEWLPNLNKSQISFSGRVFGRLEIRSWWLEHANKSTPAFSPDTHKHTQKPGKQNRGK